MSTAKAEIEELERKERRLRIEEGYVEVDSLERLKELKGLREWAGDKWVGLGEEVAELMAEIAVPGGGGGGRGGAGGGGGGGGGV